LKIRDAKQAYSAQLDSLLDKKRALSKLLEDQETGGAGMQAFDRVEISQELSTVTAQYEATQSVMEGILAKEAAVHNSAAAKQQSEALAAQAEEMAKMMEVYRRIASGGKVPAADERKLMEFSHELYMAAKTASMMAQQDDKEYDSLWEDEEQDGGETPDAHELAENTEITVSSPEATAAEAAAEIT